MAASHLPILNEVSTTYPLSFDKDNNNNYNKNNNTKDINNWGTISLTNQS